MAGVGVGTIDRSGLVNGVSYNGNLPQPGQPGYNGMQDGMAGGSGNWGQSLGGSDTRSAGNGATTGTMQALPVAAASSGTGNTATNPLQPSYLPTPPTALPTTYNASTYQNSYNPQTATNELNQAAGVQDQGQNANLMSMLAAQGISPGSSAAQAAAQNLATQQTAALAPSLVNAQEYGAGLDEQSGLANMGALNSAGQYNAGASNTMTQQNLQDLLQSQEYNASAYNNAGLASAGYQNNDWLAELQAQLGLQQTGLSTSGSLAGDQANQQVPLNPSLFSDITSGVGAAASAAAPFLGSGGGGGGGGGSTAPYSSYENTGNQDASYWGSGGG